jgi:hypothetical protein
MSAVANRHSRSRDSGVAAELAKINAARPLGTPSDVGGADQYESQNFKNLANLEPNITCFYDPTVRLDYNLTKSLSIDAVFNAGCNSAPTALFPSFPGPDFTFQWDGVNNHNFNAAIGVSWLIRPTLINQFQDGYLYNYNIQAPKSNNLDRTHHIAWWNGPWGLNFGAAGVSGDFFDSTISSLYSLISFNDNLLWQKKKHDFTFGVSFYRERDHY